MNGHCLIDFIFYRQVCLVVSSELGTAAHTSLIHELLLNDLHLLGSFYFPNSTALDALLLVLCQLVLAESRHAVAKAVLENSELHFHLGLELEVLCSALHLASLYLLKI